MTCETVCPESAGLTSYQQSLFLREGCTKHTLCHTCGVSCAGKTAYLNHIESHGEYVKSKLVCELCPYTTWRPRNLRLHSARMHPTLPRTRSHVCGECGRAFYENNVLNQHMDCVHLKKKRFQCKLCPKAFYNQKSFGTHMKIHSGERPHHCSQCEQTFYLAYNLKVHERIHTGEKPYKCKQCEAAFAQKNSLNVHMRKHMKREGISLKPGDELKLNICNEESP